LVLGTMAVLLGAVVCDVPEEPQPAITRASAKAPNNELLSPFFRILTEP
jgi:hypothetical protein